MYVCVFVGRESTRAARTSVCVYNIRRKKTWMFTLKPNVNRNNALNSQHPFGIQIEFRIYSIYVFKLIPLFVARTYMHTHTERRDSYVQYTYAMPLYIFCSFFLSLIVALFFSSRINGDIYVYWNFDRQFICNIYAQCVITHTVWLSPSAA